ncbi:MAG TPA: glycoside hydrolase family 27 protein [Draconibacterium sp.]|nr:glycoside hydrolase family 27 protein [Draconibacterium sp.]
MKSLLKSVLIITIFLGGFQNLSKAQNQNFKLWAETPPMGWNSYNCYGAAVTEKEVKANAGYMAEKMKKLGWEYIVVDYCWSYPHPPGSTQNNPPQFRLKVDNSLVPWLAMDEWGRLLPDPRKFPSSHVKGGFKPLADYIHGQGLKFGIHVMRGIPRQAVWAKTPVKGTNGITADMIADTTSLCPWLNQMYGVDMSKPGAQEYYNSLAELYAEWDVDYIKIDDIDLDEKYPYRKTEAEAMHKAILNCGRPIVLSLSLNMKTENAAHVKSVSNLWRISKDFWDEWELLEHQFELLHQWTSAREPGNWPDADMLQLGWISRRGPSGPERESRFTADEQYTHMTLWCIAQSPLMMGGDMPDNSPFVESLLTNPEVLAVNQDAYDAKQLYRNGSKVVWTSKIKGTNDVYIALFNTGAEKSPVDVSFSELGIKGKVTVRDLWEKKEVGSFSKSFSANVNSHGAKLYRITVK